MCFNFQKHRLVLVLLVVLATSVNALTNAWLPLLLLIVFVIGYNKGPALQNQLTIFLWI